MTDKQKIKILSKIINDTFWMARRYANGRRTYAPRMVRDSYAKLKKYFPDLVPKKDDVLESDRRFFKGLDKVEIQGGDWLTDIN